MRLLTFVLVVIGFAACGGGGAGDIGSEATSSDGGQKNTDGGGSDGGSTDAARKADGDIKLGDSSTGGCRKREDCNQSFEECFAPGQEICGGPAPLRECNVDDDCADAGANKICVSQSCGTTSCLAKCTDDTNCPSSPTKQTICQLATGRCIPKPCTNTSCPQHFVCPSDPSQGCVRKACKADSECGGGACVNDLCWSGPGTCGDIPA